MIARNSSFVYKGKAVDVRQGGRSACAMSWKVACARRAGGGGSRRSSSTLKLGASMAENNLIERLLSAPGGVSHVSGR